MTPAPVIAVFDIGKTNKKLFLIDEQYKIVWERTARFPETVDEDGYPCEDLEHLRSFCFELLREVTALAAFQIKAINFSTYGASLVYLNDKGEAIGHLYNYLKPFPASLTETFYSQYQGEQVFSLKTASPVLGSLNAGLQLYRIRKEKPDFFQMIHTAPHLPQYMSYLLSGKCFSDLTSIGCHTGLWDFQKQDYHKWVYDEGIAAKLAPIVRSDHVEDGCLGSERVSVGVGLHDSSAALIPYLTRFQQPFVLISSGTWCISLNPFNHTPLTARELQSDCLCYLSFEGRPVKASRLFAGKEHDEQVDRIASHFHLQSDWHHSIVFDQSEVVQLAKNQPNPEPESGAAVIRKSLFPSRDLHDLATPSAAYHQLVLDLVREQYHSTQLVVHGSPVKQIFVDGGFSNNAIYMNLLAATFPEFKVFAASVAQATAVGAAMAIHRHWNRNALPEDLIGVKPYAPAKVLVAAFRELH